MVIQSKAYRCSRSSGAGFQPWRDFAGWVLWHCHRLVGKPRDRRWLARLPLTPALSLGEREKRSSVSTQYRRGYLVTRPNAERIGTNFRQKLVSLAPALLMQHMAEEGVEYIGGFHAVHLHEPGLVGEEDGPVERVGGETAVGAFHEEGVQRDNVH